ncbi:MAG: hypothetical protein U1E65_24325 [Myxococcota bacterium]
MNLQFVGAFVAVLGLPFFIRGLRLSLKPEGTYADRMRERNLRMGLEADMRVWGRKIRRLGVLLMLIGGAIAGFASLHSR